MLYFPKIKRGFLHCPKTAGKFVRVAVQKLGIEYEEHEDEIGWYERFAEWKGPTTEYFTFVRHPAEWYRSYWADRIINGWGGDLIIAHKCVSDDFNEFVANCCKQYPGFVTNLYDRYQSPYGETYKYERLVRDLPKALAGERVGREVLMSFVRVNRCATSQDLEDRCRYYPEVYKMVVKSERHCMEKFDYVPMENPIR